VRRGIAALAICGCLAALFVTAARSPGPTQRIVVSLRAVSFNPHDGPVLKVKVRGGSCSFSLSPKDAYLYQCESSGNADPTARAIARARPRLRRHGLCVTTIFGLGGSAPLVQKCGKSLPAGVALTP
jgi:hypothetical protein